MLCWQGFPKRVVMSGQLALVFHELANAAAVPSTSPLITLKSSLIMLLKFPHRPVGWRVTQRHRYISNMCDVLQTKTHFTEYNCLVRVIYGTTGGHRDLMSSHTRDVSFKRSVSWDEDLHHGRQLDHHVNAQLESYGDVEGGWLEGTHLRCRRQKTVKKMKAP